MKIDEINNNIETILTNTNTITLSSINNDGTSHVSYAPYVKKGSNIYILISKVAKHFENITSSNKIVGILLEDESITSNLFFRKRITFNLEYVQYKKKDEILEEFIKLHGEFINKIMMMDFYVINLCIKGGQVVYGAGKAYTFDQNMSPLNQITGNHNKNPEFMYKGKRYLLINDSELGKFVDENSKSNNIKIVEKQDRIDHIYSHFKNDFGYTGDINDKTVVIMQEL